MCMHNVSICLVPSQENSVRIWKLPARPPLVFWKPKTHVTWERSRLLRRKVWLLLLYMLTHATKYKSNDIVIIYCIIYLVNINLNCVHANFYLKKKLGGRKEKRGSHYPQSSVHPLDAGKWRTPSKPNAPEYTSKMRTSR